MTVQKKRKNAKLTFAEKWFHPRGAILRRPNYEHALYPLHYGANGNMKVFCSYCFFNRTNWASVHVSLEISVFFQDSKSQDEEIAWRFKKQNSWKAFSGYMEISLVLEKS